MNIKTLEKRIKTLEKKSKPTKKPFKFSKSSFKVKNGKYWRALTEREKSLNLAETELFYDKTEEEIIKELQNIITPEIERVANKAEKNVNAGDVVSAGLLYFYLFGKIKDVLKKYYLKTYERTVKNYIKENPKFELPDTLVNQQETQYINYQAETIAKTIVDELSTEAQSKTIFGIITGISGASIANNLMKTTKDRANIFTKNTASQVISDAVGMAKKTVNKKNFNLIVAFQRTEILDRRTCAMCRDLDGRIISVDDPFANIQHLHFNCRGEWEPIEILNDNEKTEKLPKNITERFNTVSGYPQINAFKQIKKPIKDG